MSAEPAQSRTVKLEPAGKRGGNGEWFKRRGDYDLVMIFYRMRTKYMVSDGVEKLRKKKKYQTLGPLDRKKLIKWRHCGTKKTPECYRITLTKKGIKELRKK